MSDTVSRTGGMADAGDSKSPARKGVPVQVRGSVLEVLQGVAPTRQSLQIVGFRFFLTTPCEPIQTLAAPEFAPPPYLDYPQDFLDLGFRPNHSELLGQNMLSVVASNASRLFLMSAPSKP